MFDDIRPYNDDEVVAVIERLVHEKELLNSIAIYTIPLVYKLWPSCSRFIVKWSLRRRVKKLTSIKAVQQIMAQYLFRLIKKSTDGFSHHGLQNIDLTKPTLFISNHRDIALDPALVNLALFDHGDKTVEIAIGDNLLSKNWIEDLMRLNKSFIVKRNAKTKRAMLVASKKLSAYIHYALTEKQQHIWIAQKEGRAKDGVDKTNSALISMLLLNKPKPMTIRDYLEQLNIVPVAISYEFDPCDVDKAKELATIESNGAYQKSEHEDIKSITQGIVGHKGRIHIEFGSAITGDFADSKAIASEIDSRIISQYRLFESNQTAFAKLENESFELPHWQKLEQRLESLSDSQQRWLLNMYANPVRAKRQISLQP